MQGPSASLWPLQSRTAEAPPMQSKQCSRIACLGVSHLRVRTLNRIAFRCSPSPDCLALILVFLRPCTGVINWNQLILALIAIRNPQRVGVLRGAGNLPYDFLSSSFFQTSYEYPASPAGERWRKSAGGKTVKIYWLRWGKERGNLQPAPS
jgi:hypothetical protein